MAKKETVKSHLPRRDDLPAIGVSRFRALGLITPDTKRFTIELAGERREVGVAHIRFPNGGGWSFWVCPSCRRICQTLRMLDDRLVCRRCDGLLARCQMNDKSAAIARLEARLSGPSKLKPALRKAATNVRKRLELRLKRTRLTERREWLKGSPTSQ